MPRSSNKIASLKLGLIVLAVVGLAISLFIAIGPQAAITQTTDRIPVVRSLATSEYAAALGKHSPGVAAQLERDLSAAETNGTAHDLRRVTLEASLAAYRVHALALRNASNAHYDRMVEHLASGLSGLSKEAPSWCSGAALEPVFRVNQEEFIPALIDEIAAHDAAYAWALEWSEIFLQIQSEAAASPVQRGARSAYDKMILQETGLSLGPDQWQLALQIAAFSQAEGTDYATMRSVVKGVDLCNMGLALANISRRLPAGPKGRIWADLMPEIFAGNAPYALYRVNDYFFLDPA
ncbi:MAG: hypothetical protein AAF613_09735 [Pseudomonadota bacterium]